MKSTSPQLTLSTLLKTLAPLFVKPESPTSDRVIEGVCSPENGKPGHIVFVSNPHFLRFALAGPASILCFSENLRADVLRLRDPKDERPILYSKEADRALRETVQTFFFQTPYVNRDFEPLVHPTAIIHATAKVGRDVRVGPYAVIGKDVTIGDACNLGAHSLVETGCRIGARTTLHPFSYIGHRCVLGEDCEIMPHAVIGKEGFGYANDAKFNHYRIPHQGKVILEDRVHVGSNTSIDRGTFDDTIIRAGAILDNKIHIAHNVEIGENSIVTSGFAVAGSTKIGRNFVTGGNTTITGHITIGDNVQLAGMSVVRKSMNKPGQYGGNPLMSLRDSTRLLAATAYLPKMLKFFRSHVGELEGENKGDE